MKRLASAVAIMMALTVHANADVIKPNDVRATSHFGVGLNIENLVNGDQGPAVGLTHFGLIEAGGPGVLDDVHGISVSQTPDQWGYISGCNDAGIDGGDPGSCANIFAVEPVDDQIIEFEFDGSYDLSNVHIWNDNEDGFAPDRGVNEFEIQVSPDRTGATFTAVGTTYNLTADDGFSNNSAQEFPLVASAIRRVRLLINSNHGISEAYVGLAEVRFEGSLVTQDLAADADKDGNVNGSDFLLWQQNFGVGQVETVFNSTLTATQSEGDFDNNNVITGADLAVWASEFGQPSALGGASHAVPEPSTVLLGVCATLLFLAPLMSRRRNRFFVGGSELLAMAPVHLPRKNQ